VEQIVRTAGALLNDSGTTRGRHASNAGLKSSAYILALGATAAKKLKKFSHTFLGLGGYLENFHSGTDVLDVVSRGWFVEFDGEG
jgi:hypothetical protein